MLLSLTILGTGADGSTPCLMCSLEKPPPPSPEPAAPTVVTRFLFNVSEGLSRLAGVKMASWLTRLHLLAPHRLTPPLRSPQLNA